ncbi:MAG: hypothetical protein CME63_10700 [Halobacteriovoraceae bacterium]|nr:hypothetical protein [Halobacteriovoraceae bacterium]MBC98211.1 hypothetical protein [Halobacteriovoraceae bacterium]
MKKKMIQIFYGLRILKDFFVNRFNKKNFHLIPFLIILFIFSILGFLVLGSGGVSPLLYPLF